MECGSHARCGRDHRCLSLWGDENPFVFPFNLDCVIFIRHLMHMLLFGMLFSGKLLFLRPRSGPVFVRRLARTVIKLARLSRKKYPWNRRRYALTRTSHAVHVLVALKKHASVSGRRCSRRYLQKCTCH